MLIAAVAAGTGAWLLLSPAGSVVFSEDFAEGTQMLTWDDATSSARLERGGLVLETDGPESVLTGATLPLGRPEISLEAQVSPSGDAAAGPLVIAGDQAFSATVTRDGLLTLWQGDVPLGTRATAALGQAPATVTLDVYADADGRLMALRAHRGHRVDEGHWALEDQGSVTADVGAAPVDVVGLTVRGHFGDPGRAFFDDVVAYVGAAPLAP